MDILLVTHRYPPNAGGIERHVQELATRLVDRGHDVTIFSADADMQSQDVDGRIQVRRFQSWRPNDAFYVAPQITSAVRQANADIVHAHNYHSLTTFFAALGVTNERFIVTPHYHGTSANEARNRLLAAYQPIGKWALQKASSVVAVSEWERERLQSDLGINAIVIPNGIECSRFVNADPEERERPYLLCVGRLEEYKGVQYAIRALQSMADKELVIAGSGSFRPELERIAKDTGCVNRVSFLGFVDESRLPSLYAGADVHLQLSEFEAYGMTVGESLAAGTPAVVRESGALVNWTDICGVIGAKEIGSESVANAVQSAMNGPKPDPRSIPNWNNIVNRLVKIYMEG